MDKRALTKKLKETKTEGGNSQLYYGIKSEYLMAQVPWDPVSGFSSLDVVRI